MREFRDPFADIKRRGRRPTRSRTAGSEAQQQRGNDQKDEADRIPRTSPELKCYCPDLEQVAEELENISDLKRAFNPKAGTRKKMLERILEQQGCAPLGMWPENWEQLVEKFGARYPHMGELVKAMRESCALASLKETRPVALGTPLLLVGPPGVGKTDAAMFLADMVGVATRRIGCADVTNGFDMTGMSEGWAGAKPGHLAKMLILEACANPLVVLDELDKVALAGRASDSLEARLYSVLEPISAKSFRDEFLDVPLDITAFNWIATANSIESIPSPILDRFRVIQVRFPSREELRSLIPGIYRTIIENESWGEAFAPEVDESVVDLMLGLDFLKIRNIRRVIISCAAQAAIRIGDAESPIELTRDDLIQAVSGMGHDLFETIPGEGVSVH